MRVLRQAGKGHRLFREVVLIARAARRLFIAAIVCAVAASARGIAAEREHGPVAVIFMYHHVSPTVLPGPYARALTVTPQEFAAQLSWLRTKGCRIATVDELVTDVHAGQRGACEAALTFDDGYDDVATYALPLLRQTGARATFYIATGFVGQSGHVSVRQLRALAAAGMEIGAHTVHHVDLTTLDRMQARREIQESAASLRRWLHGPVTAFAYPAGRYDAAVAQDVARAGLATAVTTDPGGVSPASDSYALPRYRIERGSGLSLMQALFAVAPRAAAGAATVPTTLAHIAHERIAGNAPDVAEAVAVAILAPRFPEQVLKVHVLALPSATVAGIVLSGVKFHAPVDRRQFAGDVRMMIDRAMQAAPAVDEVDVWATVPLPVVAGAQVSGDYAVPTSRTVFSCAVTRMQAAGTPGLGLTYWDPTFLAAGAAAPAQGEHV
ncbi:MAG: polysaccharide deacetylase family protein [Candidatus Eremiobacteraeota bacterium]|nr:polysaccharide deacetylase family protein [Candidatus Eremiobacteraeota bacterium]